MLRYKILQSNNDLQIPLSLDMSNIEKKNISDEDLYSSIINPPVNIEKESYSCKTPYKIYFNFYNNSGFTTKFENAGFVFPADLYKNAFKKSLFLVEFYDNLTSKNRIFSTTLSVYPNVIGKKGPESSLISGLRVLDSIYDISIPLNEMFFIYNYRNFSNFTNTQTDGDIKYASMFVKIMFLNAKTGKVQYFMADTNTGTTLNSNEFNENLYYYEIRFYNNYKYSFYKSGVEQTDIYFKEIVIQ